MMKPMFWILLCFFWMGLGCQKHAKELAEARKKLETLQALYSSQVVSRLPGKTARQIVSCVASTLKHPEKQIPTIQDHVLKKVIDPKADTRKSKYLPTSIGTSLSLRYMAMDPKFYPLEFLNHIQTLALRNYVGVYLTEEWQTGKVENRAIVQAARFKGWFALFDLKAGKIVTQFPLHVRSARSLTAWRRKGYQANWDRAFRESVSRAMGQWTNKYLKQYCPVVTVDSRPY